MFIAFVSIVLNCASRPPRGSCRPLSIELSGTCFLKLELLFIHFSSLLVNHSSLNMGCLFNLLDLQSFLILLFFFFLYFSNDSGKSKKMRKYFHTYLIVSWYDHTRRETRVILFDDGAKRFSTRARVNVKKIHNYFYLSTRVFFSYPYSYSRAYDVC